MDSYHHESVFACENGTNSNKKSHKPSHVGLDKNNRKGREEQINVSFLQMSFLFSSGMLQATHSSQAYMTQWQLIYPWCRFTASIQTLFMQLQRTGWLPSWIRQWGACELSIYMKSSLEAFLLSCPVGSRSANSRYDPVTWSPRAKHATCNPQ